MADINRTSEAEQWLKNIYDYIAQDNPTAAARVVDGIYKKSQLLRDFHEIGRPDNNIDILGVFHGAMNMERYLFG
jgi:plasmid stabilization system protein ParE